MALKMPTAENIYDNDAWIAGAGSGVTNKDIDPSQEAMLAELTGHKRLEEQRELGRFRVVNADLEKEIGELKEQLPLDKMTGLYSSQSKITMEKIIPQILSDAERHKHGLAFLHLDLDSFKPINDSFGHAEGDKYIMAMADALREVCRLSDLTMRMALGDEFGVLVVDEQDPIAAAAALIARLKAVYAKKVTELGHPEVGFSAGIVLVDPCEKADDIFERSDKELYRAKTKRGSVAVGGRELV